MTRQILSLSLALQLRGVALRSRRFDRIVWVAIFLLCGSTAAGQTDVEGVQFFEQKIRPVLVERCYKCHSTGAKKVQSGLLLDTRQAVRAGGKRGPAVVPGNLTDSWLIEAIRHESLQMPPDGKLSDSVIADFVRWIEIGAPDPRDGAATPRAVDNDAGRQFWSFLPLGNYEPPELPEAEWALTPIDRFILARQQASGVEPSPIADRRTLLRRAHFGLTGLPPSPDETEAFLSDSSPQAYERLVDELLRSQHYGERWARYWLDVVRFAESNGFEKDEDRPNAYHYRDFVIRALNQDMPYDQFVRWQIAGDWLAPDSQSARAATGFLVAGVENVIQTEKEFERERYDKLDDIASTIGTAMLGLTIGCARCHDHKFDPISQRDYYRFLSTFGKTMSAELPLGEKGKSPVAYVAVDVGSEVTVNDREEFTFGTKKENFVLKSDVYFLSRGDVKRKQNIVTQSFPQVLMRADRQEARWQEDGVQKRAPRVALANWITDFEEGAGHLLARVIVNRLWQHHMGKGLVATPSDFGAQGERPTHPELLDWLANELIEADWRLKPIHRLIMRSAVYRQSHRSDARNERVDPQNRLLWRRWLRRLDAEAIRDAMLAVSGQLDRTMSGPGTLDESSRRRSIYLTVKRSQRIPMMQSFDTPDAIQGIGRRPTTTVAPQALLMMNNPHVHAYAQALARLIHTGFDQAPDDLIRAGFVTALARPADSQELQQMREFLAQQTVTYEESGYADASRLHAIKDFCQLLISSDEFIYVE